MHQVSNWRDLFQLKGRCFNAAAYRSGVMAIASAGWEDASIFFSSLYMYIFFSSPKDTCLLEDSDEQQMRPPQSIRK